MKTFNLIALTVSLVFAQLALFPQSELDSLENLLRKSEGNERVDLLITISKKLNRIDSKKSYVYVKEAVELSQSLDNQELLGRSYLRLQSYYLNKRKYDSAYLVLEEALKIWQELDDNKRIGETYRSFASLFMYKEVPDSIMYYSNLAIEYSSLVHDYENICISLQYIARSYANIGNMEEALIVYNQAFELKDKIDNYRVKYGMFMNMGGMYFQINDFDKSLYYYVEAAKLYEDRGDKNEEPTIYLNIANVLVKYDEFEEALNYINLHKEAVSDFEDKTALYNNKYQAAHTYFTMNRMDTAYALINEVVEYFEGLNNEGRLRGSYLIQSNIAKYTSDYPILYKSCMEGIRLCEKTNNQNLINYFYDNLSWYYLGTGDTLTATSLMKANVDRFKQQKQYQMLSYAYLKLSEIYENERQYDSSLFSYKQFFQYYDSVHSQENEQAIQNLRITHATELKEREIEALNLNLDLNQQTIRKQYYAGAAIALGLVLLAVIAIVLYRSRKRHQKINSWLEEKVHERTLQLEEAKTNLESAYSELQVLDQAKSNFLDLISHEMRTPLNGIVGAAGILKESFGEDSEFGEFIDMLKQSVDRLEEFSSSALVITQLQVEDYNIPLSTLKLNDILAETVDKKQKEIALKKLSIQSESFHDVIECKGNLNLLKKAIDDILDNAVKYSPENGNIDIKISKKGSKITIDIADSGPGFSEEAMQKLYKPFGVGQKHHDKHVGLSLPSAKLIMEAHGGTIHVENLEAGGAKVSLSIPD